MKVIIGCEYSGIIRDAFIAKGHDAISCDLLQTEKPGPHYQGDIEDYLYFKSWDLLIAHPPCTYLTNSAEWAYSDKPMIKGKPRKIKPGTLIGQERRKARENAIKFFKMLWYADIPKICIENPIGVMSRFIKPSQYIQPYDFGDNASKRTSLWLKNLPPLQTTGRIDGRMVEWPPNSGKMVERWENQTDSGQNRLSPSEDRGHIRSATYQGWADAMADQWG